MYDGKLNRKNIKLSNELVKNRDVSLKIPRDTFDAIRNKKKKSFEACGRPSNIFAKVLHLRHHKTSIFKL